MDNDITAAFEAEFLERMRKEYPQWYADFSELDAEQLSLFPEAEREEYEAKRALLQEEGDGALANALVHLILTGQITPEEAQGFAFHDPTIPAAIEPYIKTVKMILAEPDKYSQPIDPAEPAPITFKKMIYQRIQSAKDKPSAGSVAEIIIKLVSSLPEAERGEAAAALKEAFPSLYFPLIRQGEATNSLTKVKPVEGKNTVIDPITGDATITKGTTIIAIPKYKELVGLRASAYRLLDAITISLTESGAKTPRVCIPLSDYMESCGLSDRKAAKEQVKADMEVLRKISISWEEKRGSTILSYKFMNLADSGEVRRNGDIVFTFGPTFFDVLKGYWVMPYSPELLKVNNKRNPNSYSLGRKMLEHKNMNAGKKNEYIIAVKTLLDAATDIPSYEDVAASNRHFTERIIDPFERDLDALSKMFSWEYCHSNGAPLTDKEAENMDYNTFQGLLIKVTWHNYPDQTARLERKEARANEAKAAAPKGRKPYRRRKRDTDPPGDA